MPEQGAAGGWCIATVATPGFDALLDGLLGSLRRNAQCADAAVAVFLVGADPRCADVVKRHGALRIDCEPRARINTAVKSALYSVAEVLEADKYLCLDVDMLVLDSLRPVFDALDGLPGDAILCCAEGDRPFYRDLEHALLSIYGGHAGDFERLIGQTDGEQGYTFVVNEGLFAGTRTALRGLAATIRAMPNASAWIDQRDDNWWRSQFVFNLALAKRNCGVELDRTYNVQLHVQDVEVSRSGKCVRASSAGQPVHVLHFNGAGRAKLQSYSALLEGSA